MDGQAHLNDLSDDLIRAKVMVSSSSSQRSIGSDGVDGWGATPLPFATPLCFTGVFVRERFGKGGASASVCVPWGLGIVNG